MAAEEQRTVSMVGLKVNGRDYRIDAFPDTPLLSVLRDQLRVDGNEVRLRRGLLRRLHRSRRRRGDALLRDPRLVGPRQKYHDDRGPLGGRLPPGAEGVDRG